MPHINNQSPYRFRKGEGFGANAWANTAVTVAARIRVVYDSGLPDDFFLNETTLTSARATNLITCGQHVAAEDGVVTSFAVTKVAPGATQRGQVYFSAYMTGNPFATTTITKLAAGYLYEGHENLMLGEIVEPGPAGGQGSLTNVPLASPAAGADYATVTAPAGAYQRIRGFFGQLVTGAGVANREFSIQLFATTIRAGVVAGEIQTASLTVDYVGLSGGISSSGVTSNLAGGVTMIGLGMFDAVLGTNNIAFKTYNIQAADQWGIGNILIEEWVMPN